MGRPVETLLDIEPYTEGACSSNTNDQSMQVAGLAKIIQSTPEGIPKLGKGIVFMQNLSEEILLSKHKKEKEQACIYVASY